MQPLTLPTIDPPSGHLAPAREINGARVQRSGGGLLPSRPAVRGQWSGSAARSGRRPLSAGACSRRPPAALNGLASPPLPSGRATVRLPRSAHQFRFPLPGSQNKKGGCSGFVPCPGRVPGYAIPAAQPGFSAMAGLSPGGGRAAFRLLIAVNPARPLPTREPIAGMAGSAKIRQSATRQDQASPALSLFGSAGFRPKYTLNSEVARAGILTGPVRSPEIRMFNPAMPNRACTASPPPCTPCSADYPLCNFHISTYPTVGNVADVPSSIIPCDGRFQSVHGVCATVTTAATSPSETSHSPDAMRIRLFVADPLSVHSILHSSLHGTVHHHSSLHTISRFFIADLPSRPCKSAGRPVQCAGCQSLFRSSAACRYMQSGCLIPTVRDDPHNGRYTPAGFTVGVSAVLCFAGKAAC